MQKRDDRWDRQHGDAQAHAGEPQQQKREGALFRRRRAAFIGRRDSHGSVRPNWLRMILSENRLPLFGIMRSRSARHRGLAARKVVTAEPSINQGFWSGRWDSNPRPQPWQ